MWIPELPQQMKELQARHVRLLIVACCFARFLECVVLCSVCLLQEQLLSPMAVGTGKHQRQHSISAKQPAQPKLLLEEKIVIGETPKLPESGVSAKSSHFEPLSAPAPKSPLHKLGLLEHKDSPHANANHNNRMAQPTAYDQPCVRWLLETRAKKLQVQFGNVGMFLCLSLSLSFSVS